ncbi:MAG TPA: hypothetical protein VF892_03590, partial [Pseudonocardiaceae bacterium]
MIISVHVADVGVRGVLAALRMSPRPGSRPGLRCGAMMLTAPLSGSLLSRPDPHRVGLLTFWDNDDALDAFLAEDPVAARLADGWHARLAPTRVVGDWPGLSDDPPFGPTDGPAITVTLGRLRCGQTPRFLRASARAEAQALAAPGFVWGVALARPPMVATCSVWRD